MREYGPSHKETLAAANNFAVALWKNRNAQGACELLMKHEGDAPDSASMLLYARARIACLEGDLAEGERLLLRHLGSHPKRTALALANPDFAELHGCIRSARNVPGAAE